MNKPLLRAAGLAVLVAWFSGCSASTSDRRAVSGTVTYHGEPVAIGEIYFETDVSKGNNGPQAVGDIKDGRYKTRSEFGAVAGPHIVRITILPGASEDPGDIRVRRTGAPLGDYFSTVDIQPGVPQINFDLPFPRTSDTERESHFAIHFTPALRGEGDPRPSNRVDS